LEPYRIVLDRQVVKTLKKIEKNALHQIIKAIDDLAFKPRPAGVKKLKGELFYRIRVGNYHIIYEIEDKALRILVLAVGHRGGIYKELKRR